MPFLPHPAKGEEGTKGSWRLLHLTMPEVRAGGASQGSIPAGIYPAWKTFGWRTWERQSSKMLRSFHPTDFWGVSFYWGWPQFGAYNLIWGEKYLIGKGESPSRAAWEMDGEFFLHQECQKRCVGFGEAPFVSSLAFLWRVSSKLSSQKRGFFFVVVGLFSVCDIKKSATLAGFYIRKI